jgi:glyoxylase-like metal-dependent hydrolase (beta-lactamase superfamily II)
LTQRLQWIEEGAHQVAAGVYRIPLPLPSDGLRAVNVYAIEAASGLVLIDSGWALANARDQLERSLAAIGAALPDVRQFLVTHLHRDHYTQAIEVRRLFGTPVALGAEEKHSIDALLGTDFRPLGAQLVVLARAGAGELARQLAEWTSFRHTRGEQDSPFSVSGIAGEDHPAIRPAETFAAAVGYEAPDEWIGPGQVFDLGTRTLTAIPTPGHTRGHVVFVDAAAGLLFAGDHVLPHITPSIAFEERPSASPLADYLESLNVVRRLPDMRLLPAHGPVSPSTHARIDELADHHDSRLRAMTEVLSAGELTASEVAGAIPWTSRQRKLADLDPMNQMLAICETVYHLNLLVAKSAATCRTDDDGVRSYSTPSAPAGGTILSHLDGHEGGPRLAAGPRLSQDCSPAG